MGKAPGQQLGEQLTWTVSTEPRATSPSQAGPQVKPSWDWKAAGQALTHLDVQSPWPAGASGRLHEGP